MHLQLGGALFVGQRVEKLEEAAFLAAIEHHCAMALHRPRPAVVLQICLRHSSRRITGPPDFGVR